MTSRVALVVGVGKYEAPYRALKCCPPSAIDVFKLLTSDQFGQCEPDPRSILITDEHEPINPARIFGAVDTILGSLHPGDMFIFYFCGHGDLSENKLFLMTSKSKRAQDGYNVSTLMERLGNYNLANAIIIVDACFSQALFNAIKDWGQSRLPDNCGLLASAGHFQIAEEDSTEGKTRFSFYFCEGIENGCAEIAPADSHIITLDAMKTFVSKQLFTRYGANAQKIQLLTMGSMEKLWISKRKNGAAQYVPPKAIIDQVNVLQIFQKAQVSPKQCTAVLGQLKFIRENLNIPIQKIDTEYRVREQIDHLVKRIEKHRMSGRKDISKADERAGILSDLQALFSEYNKARFIH